MAITHRFLCEVCGFLVYSYEKDVIGEIEMHHKLDHLQFWLATWEAQLGRPMRLSDLNSYQ